MLEAATRFVARQAYRRGDARVGAPTVGRDLIVGGWNWHGRDPI
jgi:hypothetical protein